MADGHHTGGIAWQDWPGDGPVAVCLHGIGSRASGWAALAACLPGWRLIAWDAPGYGASAPLPMDWPVAAEYARALENWLAALDLHGVHLIGHSLGTLIGAAHARAFPQRLASLTLASCAQGGGVAPGTALPAAHQARIDDLARLGAPGFAAARAPRLFHDAPQALIDAATATMATVTLPGYAQAVRMLASGDLATDCAHITTPTAVTVGAEDVVTPPAQSARANAALQNPRAFVTIPHCGHALPLQAPQALADLIQSGAAP